MGDASAYGELIAYVQGGMDVPAQPEALISPGGGGERPRLGVDGLPDAAIICSCNNVQKGAICARDPRPEADRGRRREEVHQGR